MSKELEEHRDHYIRCFPGDTEQEWDKAISAAQCCGAYLGPVHIFALEKEHACAAALMPPSANPAGPPGRQGAPLRILGEEGARPKSLEGAKLPAIIGVAKFDERVAYETMSVCIIL